MSQYFTEAQHRAVHTTDRHLVVTAGAGSGKTYVLVSRYLHLLSENPDWPINALVAITFTRAAAMEMRDRVRRELESRYNQADGTARERWQGLLSQVNSARINTIHGLCTDILRANAAEAGVDPGFEVIEDVPASLLLADVIDDVIYALDSSEDDAELRYLFTRFTKQRISETLARPDLMTLDLDDVPDDPQVMLAQWRSIREQMFHDELPDLMATIDAHLWEPILNAKGKLGALSERWQTVGTYWNALSPNDDIETIIQNLKGIEGINVQGATAGGEWGDDGKTARADLKLIRDQVRAFLKKVGDELADDDRDAAQLTVFWARLLRRVQRAYAAAKQARAVLDFDDLEAMTVRLLRDHPGVRERYAGREFRHLLVDEFQDTNARQWALISALAGEDIPGTLFLVGDMKQSIYAFRGADVRVFDQVREVLAQDGGGESVALATSFRTHAPLLRVFNALFGALMTRDEDDRHSAYHVQFDGDMSAHRSDEPNPCPVELMLMNKSYSSDLDGHKKGDTLPSHDRRDWEAQLIGQRIQQMVDQQEPIWDKEVQALRPFRYSDAALLFQSTTHVTRYEAAFKDLGIPYVTVAGRGYFRRTEVWDVLNVLRAVQNPADDLALAAGLRSPIFGLSDEGLFALRNIWLPDDDEAGTKRGRMPLWDALQHASQHDVTGVDVDDLAAVRSAQRCLGMAHASAGRVTVAELMRAILDATGYLAVLTGLPDGARMRRNVEKLVSIAEDSRLVTLDAFIRYQNAVKDREVREGEASLDAGSGVKLMTVHASKGLEFPVVFIPDASWKRGSGGEQPALLYSDQLGLASILPKETGEDRASSFIYGLMKAERDAKELAESRRKLYVAATRARDRLIISGSYSENKNGNTAEKDSWLSWLIDSFDLADVERQPETAFTVDGTKCRLLMPDYVRPERQPQIPDGHWQRTITDASPQPPPLLAPPTHLPAAASGHITASQLASLGAAQHSSKPAERRFYQRQFRQPLDGATPRLRRVSRAYEAPVPQRIIGDMVHEALRGWHLPGASDISPILGSYAWQKGLRDAEQIETAVMQALGLLRRFERSEVYGWISAARQAGRPVYPELPFIYKTGQHITHGVMDLLFQHDDGGWRIVDYKTSSVAGGSSQIRQHAQRYHLQVAAYASAVYEQLGGVAPEIYIHYIRYGTVQLDYDACQHELARLDEFVNVDSDD